MRSRTGITTWQQRTLHATDGGDGNEEVSSAYQQTAKLQNDIITGQGQGVSAPIARLDKSTGVEPLAVNSALRKGYQPLMRESHRHGFWTAVKKCQIAALTAVLRVKTRYDLNFVVVDHY